MSQTIPYLQEEDESEYSEEILPIETDIDSDNEEYLESYRKYKDDFIDSDISHEHLLSEKSERYTVYPIKFPTIWKMVKVQRMLNWIPEEIKFHPDLDDWNDPDRMDEDEKHFIKWVLAFFAFADSLVNSNIEKNLIDQVKILEAKMSYAEQARMENIHAETYSIMLDTFVTDSKEKLFLLDSIKTIPCIAQKAIWFKKWIDCDKPFSHKLVASAIVEGVLFSGAFASIFWLKTKGSIMPGLRKSNKFIARDEFMHVMNAVEIYHLLNNKIKPQIVYQIMKEAVKIEKEFINGSLPRKLLGMNQSLMVQYVKYCADRLLVQLGYNKLYGFENPLEYMKKIDMYCKTNFFEGRNDQYIDSKVDSNNKLQLLKYF